MELCHRCHRAHSGGVCGIPGYSTIHSPGLVPTRARTTGSSGKVGYDRMAERRKATQRQAKRETLLETLLSKNRERQAKVKELLKNMPSEMPEFNQLQERLEKLMDSERILLRQLALQ